MLFSQLMRLPNWVGEIRLTKRNTDTRLDIALDGSCLTFKHEGKFYNIDDQLISMAENGEIFIRIKARNRKLFKMPTGIYIQLLDKFHRPIPRAVVAEYLPVPHSALMA